MNEDPHFSDAGILSGPEISDQVAAGRIKIEPVFEDKYLNPASYDLTLGRKVAVYKEAVDFIYAGSRYSENTDGKYRNNHDEVLNLTTQAGDWLWPRAECILSAKEKNEVVTFEIQQTGWLLKPGIGYLMHTAERISTDDFVPVLDGKSSLGRLFMTAHVTAGYGDPGFDGQYTLEVVVTQPVIVYPGMRFCQIRFHTMVGRRIDYKKQGGHYVGELAEGPVPSMSWKQFEGR